jgi:inorganic triphosphatase YgiF
MNGQVTDVTEASPATVSLRAGADAKNEVELKLLVPAGEMETLRTAPLLARHAKTGVVVRQLDAVYYDTPDRILFSQDLSLRVRRSGDRYMQTLKQAPPHDQPFARGEWEVPVDSMAPDLASVPAAAIGELPKDVSADALRPIFVTKVCRTVQQLELSGATIEIAFDEGSIEAGSIARR